MGGSRMKILVVSHDSVPYDLHKAKNRWTRFPYLFSKLGHKVKYVYKKDWLRYLFMFIKFKPNVVISIGKIAGLITGMHHMVYSGDCIFVHDLTDHFSLYRSNKRIWFFRNNHDFMTSPSYYNFKTYECNDYIPNGTNFSPIKVREKEFEYDACYLGQLHPIYNLAKLSKECKREGIKLKFITTPVEQSPKQISKCRICVYPISWDSSIKMYDYAAMKKPVVAIKPNLSENIGYPAYYCEDLGKGIRYLLKNKKKAKKVGEACHKWYKKTSGTWEDQAKRYLKLLNKYMKNKEENKREKENKKQKKNKQIFSMDVEKDINAGLKFAKLLAKKDLKGEFYICGYLVEKHPTKIKQIADMGHVIGGHGYHHEDFAKLSYKRADKIIKKTVNVFKKNNINIVGWRFPGLSFRNNQLKILEKYGLYDSSIRDVQLHQWGKLIFLRNWLRNFKKGILFFPSLFPKSLIEKPWSYADLNEKDFYTKSGRLITHCYNIKELSKIYKEIGK